MILPFDRIEVQATAGRIFADGYVGAVVPEDHACMVDSMRSWTKVCHQILSTNVLLFEGGEKP